MPIYKLGLIGPVIAPTAYVAPNATLVGNVMLADEVSVWFGATLRGDNEPIAIGAKTNVQDLAVLHTDIGYPLTIGTGVTVGHQSTLHGCTIGDGSLIGIQAVILNGAVIGKHCLVGAGALITERKRFPDRALIIGRPAKVARELTDAELREVAKGVADYVQKIARYRMGLASLSGDAS
jgi:carbonic anhydrase/acetyltransferase-like protein (isoleucine patch superfamily)